VLGTIDVLQRFLQFVRVQVENRLEPFEPGIVYRDQRAARLLPADLPAVLLRDARERIERGLSAFRREFREEVGRDVGDLAVAHPGIRTLGVRVDAIGDELLAVAQDFDAVFVAERIERIEAHLLERAQRGEDEQPLRRHADTHGSRAQVLQAPRFHRLGDILIVDVEVDGRVVARQDADVSVRVTVLRPTANIGFRGFEFLPAVECRPFPTRWDGDDAIPQLDEAQALVQQYGLTHGVLALSRCCREGRVPPRPPASYRSGAATSEPTGPARGPRRSTPRWSSRAGSSLRRAPSGAPASGRFAARRSAAHGRRSPGASIPLWACGWSLAGGC